MGNLSKDKADDGRDAAGRIRVAHACVRNRTTVDESGIVAERCGALPRATFSAIRAAGNDVVMQQHRLSVQVHPQLLFSRESFR